MRLRPSHPVLQGREEPAGLCALQTAAGGVSVRRAGAHPGAHPGLRQEGRPSSQPSGFHGNASGVSAVALTPGGSGPGRDEGAAPASRSGPESRTETES